MDFDDPVENDRLWFGLVCNKEELERVMNVQNGHDYILRLKADIYSTHTRIFRVMRARASALRQNSLMFDVYGRDFDDCLEKMSEVDRMICEDVPAGYILMDRTDAVCLKTEFGDVVVVSEALRYALYFWNLAIHPRLPHDLFIPAILIAVRTLLLSETLDFDLDPRGEVPPDIEEDIRRSLKLQMQFIICHEYAHRILGHMSQGTRRMAIARGVGDDGMINRECIMRAHADEFEADEYSITSPLIGDDERRELLIAAVQFFHFLSLYEPIAERIDKDLKEEDSHPSPNDRVRNLVRKFSKNLMLIEDGAYENMMRIDEMREVIMEEYDNDALTTYGSIYLDQWRKRVLIDRVDY